MTKQMLFLFLIIQTDMNIILKREKGREFNVLQTFSTQIASITESTDNLLLMLIE